MTREILLTKGHTTTVDDHWFTFLSQWGWLYNMGYAVRWEGRGAERKMIHMHRVIAGTPDNMVTDHVNGNPLDNRECNLRICTRAENQRNRKRNSHARSQYKGIYWRRVNRKWLACIWVNNKQLYLGHYADERAAALAYDRAAREHYGEFARCNFPT